MGIGRVGRVGRVARAGGGSPGPDAAHTITAFQIGTAGLAEATTAAAHGLNSPGSEVTVIISGDNPYNGSHFIITEGEPTKFLIFTPFSAGGTGSWVLG